MKKTLLSTSAAHGFKDYEYSLEKAPGVFRIFVLGDSLAFGQGVKIDESFSKVLEVMLNRKSASTLYEVINSSVPGMNAIQEYCLQKTLGVHYQPDIYLLALCHNDAELKQPPDNNDYDQHINNIWNPESESFGYFAESLRRMKKTADSHGAKLVVAYFVFCDESLAPQVPTVLSNLCEELSISFTDVGKSTKRYPSKELWVNEVETHPNPLAHRIGAQHIATFLNKQGFLPQENSNTDERKLLLQHLEAHVASDHVLRSESVTNPLGRIFSLLKTKMQRQSFGQKGKGLLSKPQIEKTLASISPLLRRSQLLECLEGYDTYLRTVCIQNQIPLFDTKQMLSDLGVSMFYLSMSNQKRTILPDMISHADEQPSDPDLVSFQSAREELSTCIQSLEHLDKNIDRSFNGSLDVYQNLSDTECFLAPALKKIAQRMSGWAKGCYRPFALFVAEAHRLGLVLDEIGSELVNEIEIFKQLKETDFPDADQFRRYRHFVWETVDFFLYAFGHYKYCLGEVNIEGLSKITYKIAEGSAQTWEGRDVEFEIAINCPKEQDYTHLGLLWTNIVPISAVQRDTMAIQADGQDHSYRYKFFTGVMGYFVVEIKNCDPSHIKYIRMHLNGKSVREWSGEQLKNVLENGLRSELLILNEDE